MRFFSALNLTHVPGSREENMLGEKQCQRNPLSQLQMCQHDKDFPYFSRIMEEGLVVWKWNTSSSSSSTSLKENQSDFVCGSV